MIFRFLSLLIGYAFGLFQSAAVAGKLKGIDIRAHGSGNAGTTNAFRVLGVRLGIAVFICDVLKAAIAALIVRFAFINFIGSEDIMLFMCYAIVGVVLGHCFPFYNHFKGGKGVAETFGGMLVIDWRLTLIAFGIFIIIVLFTRYVSLGSVISAIVYMLLWIAAYFFGYSLHSYDQATFIEMSVLIIFMTGLIVVRHISNIKRLLSGTENKFGVKETSYEKSSVK